VARTAKVGDQNPVKRLLEKSLQGRTAPASIHHVEGGVLIGETPQPMRFPIHPPAGFIGV